MSHYLSYPLYSCLVSKSSIWKRIFTSVR